MMMRTDKSCRAAVQKLSIVIALTAMLGACQDNDQNTTESDEVSAPANSEMLTTELGNIDDLSISAKLIDSAQLGSALDGQGSYTVFLPVDDAWKSLNADELQSIESTENRPQLIAVLRQHIAPGYILATDLEKGLSDKNGSVTISTMGAMPITLYRDGETIALGQGKDAPRIVGAPVVAGNDVIYRIDRLIPPPD
ncbi:MAG: fasciclin domain-containing protein [Sphingomonadales bacterium]|nr:fasciclin domain-containing protein [Sphingomonadales bacterium]